MLKKNVDGTPNLDLYIVDVGDYNMKGVVLLKLKINNLKKWIKMCSNIIDEEGMMKRKDIFPKMFIDRIKSPHHNKEKEFFVTELNNFNKLSDEIDKDIKLNLPRELKKDLKSKLDSAENEEWDLLKM